MVRVSGTAKVESVVERLFVMKKSREKIDLLLEKNAVEQLSRINWERFNAAISNRLDRARQKTSFSIYFPSVLKVAATIACAGVSRIYLQLNAMENCMFPHQAVPGFKSVAIAKIALASSNSFAGE